MFLAMLSAGVWLGWRDRPRAAPVPEIPAPVVRLPRKPEPRWSPGEFRSHVLDLVVLRQQPGYDPLAEVLAGWSEAEIRAALDEGLEDPECVLPGGSGVAAMDALFGEWMERDLESAIAWFDGIKIDPARVRMASGLSYRWPAGHADRGLEFVLTHRDIFVDSSPWSILAKNFEASARSGADALGRMLERVSDEGLDLRFGDTTFLPADFDYSAFVRTGGFLKTRDEPAVSALLSGWMVQDRDAAFDWLIENKGPSGLVEFLPESREAQLENWEWLGAKVGTLDEENRESLLAALEPAWRQDSIAGDRFAEGIEDPELRDEVHGIGARVILRGAVEPAIRSLEKIEDPAKRVTILLAMERAGDPLAGSFRQPVSESTAALLREKLAEWQADEDQINAILKELVP